jgi:hypothetical protein
MRPERLTTESPIAGTTPQTSEPKVRISEWLACIRDLQQQAELEKELSKSPWPNNYAERLRGRGDAFERSAEIVRTHMEKMQANDQAHPQPGKRAND